MKKYLSKVAYCLFYCFYKSLYFIKPFIPYEIAKAHIAYQYYKKTTLYRERLVCFGPEFAFKAYMEFDDYKYFKSKLIFTDKLKALFIPYNYINKDTTL